MNPASSSFGPWIWTRTEVNGPLQASGRGSVVEILEMVDDLIDGVNVAWRVAEVLNHRAPLVVAQDLQNIIYREIFLLRPTVSSEDSHHVLPHLVSHQCLNR